MEWNRIELDKRKEKGREKEKKRKKEWNGMESKRNRNGKGEKEKENKTGEAEMGTGTINYIVPLKYMPTNGSYCFVQMRPQFKIFSLSSLSNGSCN